ncbi:hypothetical protein Tco_0130682, partial [Tanacetum coccineum]
VYVDDIIFGSTNNAWCDEFEVLMKGEFEMSAMGEMTFFLGLQCLFQTSSYSTDFSSECSQENFQVSKGATKTRLTVIVIMLVLIVIGNPLQVDVNFWAEDVWKVPKLGLWYPKDSPFQLEAYSDSDYAGSHGDRKSTTGQTTKCRFCC